MGVGSDGRSSTISDGGEGAGTISYDVGFPFTYASSKVATASCTFSAPTSSNYAVRFSVYDWNATWDTTALGATTELGATANDTKRVATVALTSVTDGAAPTVTANAQSGGTNGNWGIATTSTATYTDATKVMV